MSVNAGAKKISLYRRGNQLCCLRAQKSEHAFLQVLQNGRIILDLGLHDQPVYVAKNFARSRSTGSLTSRVPSAAASRSVTARYFVDRSESSCAFFRIGSSWVLSSDPIEEKGDPQSFPILLYFSN